MSLSWTDERIATLTKMWEGGATASQIADELGGVSRNAVIGKAHRLGLKARPSPVKANEEPEAKAKAKKKDPKPVVVREAREPRPAERPVPVAPAATDDTPRQALPNPTAGMP